MYSRLIVGALLCALPSSAVSISTAKPAEGAATAKLTERDTFAKSHDAKGPFVNGWAYGYHQNDVAPQSGGSLTPSQQVTLRDDILALVSEGRLTGTQPYFDGEPYLTPIGDADVITMTARPPLSDMLLDGFRAPPLNGETGPGRSARASFTPDGSPAGRPFGEAVAGPLRLIDVSRSTGSNRSFDTMQPPPPAPVPLPASLWFLVLAIGGIAAAARKRAGREVTASSAPCATRRCHRASLNCCNC